MFADALPPNVVPNGSSGVWTSSQESVDTNTESHVRPDMDRPSNVDDETWHVLLSQEESWANRPLDSQNARITLSCPMPTRSMTLPDGVVNQVSVIPSHSTLDHVPTSCLKRFATAWIECLEGGANGDPKWCTLAQIRAPLLLGAYDSQADRVQKMKFRLDLWEQGRIPQLTVHVLGQRQDSISKRRRHVGKIDHYSNKRGQLARKKARTNAFSKSLKALNQRPLELSVQQKVTLGRELVPTADYDCMPSDREFEAAQLRTWGDGDMSQVKKALAHTYPALKKKGFPTPRFAVLSAPGPTGERPEHLADVMELKHVSLKRRLCRALDTLSVQWIIGNLSKHMAWILDTNLTLITKMKETGAFDVMDQEWLQDYVEDLEVVDVPQNVAN